jgi:hypothetical protein
MEEGGRLREVMGAFAAGSVGGLEAWATLAGDHGGGRWTAGGHGGLGDERRRWTGGSGTRPPL